MLLPDLGPEMVLQGAADPVQCPVHLFLVRRLQRLKPEGEGVAHPTRADLPAAIDVEQPNLDNPSESHLYFDPGDGRLITIFTNEDRTPDPSRTATDPGCVHHVALSISQATFWQVVERLDERVSAYHGRSESARMNRAVVC